MKTSNQSHAGEIASVASALGNKTYISAFFGFEYPEVGQPNFWVIDSHAVGSNNADVSLSSDFDDLSFQFYSVRSPGLAEAGREDVNYFHPLSRAVFNNLRHVIGWNSYGNVVDGGRNILKVSVALKS